MLLCKWACWGYIHRLLLPSAVNMEGILRSLSPGPFDSHVWLTERDDNNQKLVRIRDGSSGKCSIKDKGALALGQTSPSVQAGHMGPSEGMQSGPSAWSYGSSV